MEGHSCAPLGAADDHHLLNSGYSFGSGALTRSLPPPFLEVLVECYCHFARLGCLVSLVLAL